MAEDANPFGAEHGGHVEGVYQHIVGGAVGRIEGEVDFAIRGFLAGRRPFQQRRDKGRHAEPCCLDPAGDLAALLESHAEQVLSIHRAHIEASHLMLGAERDHFVEGGTDFVADDGECETRKGHGASLLWTALFG